MKNKFNITLLAIIIIALLGCSKESLLNKKPLDKLSAATVWESIDLVEAYVNNQYRVLPGLGWYLWIRSYQLTDFTDEAVHKYNYHNLNDYWKGIMGPSNPTGIDTWSYQYKFIKGCNVFLANIDKLPVNNPAEKTRKDQMTGEIYALRAWSYMDLAARYGGVVLITKPFTLNEDFTRKRSSFDSTVALVVSDLDKAIALLPVSYTSGGDYGRITKGAVMAMKSRILLYAASPLFNPTNDKSKWQKAAAAAKAVIDLNRYSLAPNYKQIFLTNQNSEIILARLADNKESNNYYGYFQIVEGLGGGIDGNGYASGWSTTMVSQNMVDDFEWQDGTKFDWNNPHDRLDPYGIGANGQVNANGQPLKKRDPRFYASVTFDGSKWIKDSTVQFWVCEQSNHYNLNPFDPSFKMSNNVYGRNSVANPTKKQDCPELSYIYRKSMDPNYNIATEMYPREVPWIIFRYAEILLNYSEASFETGDEATARTYLNKIRSRVNLPPVTASGDALRQAIHHERKIELCFEGQYYFDARRWKVAYAEYNKPILGMRIVKDKNSETKVYNVFEFQKQRIWPEKYYLQPIPQYELDKVQLKQNPGY